MPRRSTLPIASNLAMFVLAAACAAPPTGRVAARQVTLRNPTGAELLLHAVVRDGFGSCRPLGRARRTTIELPPGRYAVRVGDDRALVPLPLPPRELGFEPPQDLSVTVLTSPPELTGFCWIPPGIGLRGDELGVGQEDERPLQTPFVGGFWLAACETTNAQYAAFLNELGRDRVDPGWLDLDGAKCRIEWHGRTQRFRTDAPDLPVVTVSWPGAVAYCDWLTETTGVRHRLPTETEWEKAARGPGSRVYAYGDTCRTDLANQESGRLRPVGQFPPNGFGLYDMTANAFEWCLEAYARRAYAGEPPDDDPRAYRVLRGGSYVLDGIFCRNAMRMRLRPDVRADDVGFRVLREAAATR